IAQTHPYMTRHRLQWKRLVKVLVQPLLSAGNVVVVVLGLQRNDREPGLPRAWCLDEQRLRALHSNLVTTEFLYQVEAQIEGCMAATAAVEATVLRHHQFRHPLHLRIFLTELTG